MKCRAVANPDHVEESVRMKVLGLRKGFVYGRPERGAFVQDIDGHELIAIRSLVFGFILRIVDPGSGFGDRLRIV